MKVFECQSRSFVIGSATNRRAAPNVPNVTISPNWPTIAHHIGFNIAMAPAMIKAGEILVLITPIAKARMDRKISTVAIVQFTRLKYR